MKKTIVLQNLKDKINAQLANPALSDETKMELCSILESSMREARAYNGFNYLYWMTIGFNLWIKAGKPDDTTNDEFTYGPTGQRYARKYY